MKLYGTPKVGDTVWHIDEPSQGHEGVVEQVDDAAAGLFWVRWYDGEVEDYEINDHPDIVVLELS